MMIVTRFSVPAFAVLVCLAAFVALTRGAHSIADYGAIEGVNSDDAAWTNAGALTKALAAANSDTAGDRIALVPAGSTYYYFYISVANLTDVVLRIDGTLVINNNITAWPSTVGHTLASIYIADSSNVTLDGSGLIDGQGYEWWWWVILGNPDHRPHMICMETCSEIVIKDLRFENSPQYHVLLKDAKDVHVHSVDIKVNVDDQERLLRRGGFWREVYAPDGSYRGGLPTFPLNTDGIDPSAINVLIENVTIQNYDDAVAVKPLNGGDHFSSCSQDMVIRDSRVRFGLGMTIGSVPPNEYTNCVRNITFDNISFETPIKAIYVKTNPGTIGNGSISDITYRNIYASESLWYPLWIGPQQQKQPGTAGTGCSFAYPQDPACPTQPRVPVTDITLDNVTFVGGGTLPGVLLCNATRPCTGFVFNDVINQGEWTVQDNYVCKNVEGTVTGNTNPKPPCF